MKEKKLVKQLKMQKDIEVPWHVWTKIGRCAQKINVSGNQASLTNEGDYGTLDELRKTVEFYVDQLGGKVNWEK